MKIVGTALLITVALTISVPADAETLTYNFHLTAPNGTPVTDLALFATGGGEDDVYLSPIVLPASGVSQLTHALDFEPTDALIIGISKRTTEEKWDIIMFADDKFVSSSQGLRFGELFPNDRNPRHRDVPPLLQAAHDGDQDALDQITAFLSGADASEAYFDPYGSYSIVQFTPIGPPNGGPVPEPSAFVLAFVGVLSLSMIGRRRRNR